MVDRQDRLSSLFDSFTEADDYQSSITDDAIYTDSGISKIADQLQVKNKDRKSGCSFDDKAGETAMTPFMASFGAPSLRMKV